MKNTSGDGSPVGVGEFRYELDMGNYVGNEPEEIRSLSNEKIRSEIYRKVCVKTTGGDLLLVDIDFVLAIQHHEHNGLLMTKLERPNLAHSPTVRGAAEWEIKQCREISAIYNAIADRLERFIKDEC